MSIGYACVHIGSNKTKLSSLRLSNSSEENIKEVIHRNLNALGEIIEYNIRNNIKLYRISSDIIPLGSHPANKVRWWLDFKPQLESIGKQILDAGVRVSMHPGQYTVLNSIRSEVVKAAVKDLEYHNAFLDSLGCDFRSKIILHIGGVYSDKTSSINRFIENFNLLKPNLKKRIAIENDDKSYNIQDVLYISEKTGSPVVFDTLHHELNPPMINDFSEYTWIQRASETWKEYDGSQKIHYSQPGNNRKRGAHSNTIITAPFLDFYESLPLKPIDIMLEVKDKNLSAVKCIMLTADILPKSSLEKEWARYKYLILSRSASVYEDIRNLFNNSNKPDPLAFYSLIEKALNLKGDIGSQTNAAMHIWGYFKKTADEKTKRKIMNLLDGYKNGRTSLKTIKTLLFKLVLDNSDNYLLDSLYFHI